MVNYLKRSSLIVRSNFQVLNELANGADSVDVSPAEFSKEVTCDWENSVKVDDLRSSRKLSDQTWDKNNIALACRYFLSVA